MRSGSHLLSPKKGIKDHFAVDPSIGSLEFNRTSVFHKKRMTSIAAVNNPMVQQPVDYQDKQVKLKARYKNTRDTAEYFRDTTESLTGGDQDQFDSNLSSIMQ